MLCVMNWSYWAHLIACLHQHWSAAPMGPSVAGWQMALVWLLLELVRDIVSWPTHGIVVIFLCVESVNSH